MDSSSPGKGKVNAVMNRQVPSNAQKATISCTCAALLCTLLVSISGNINTLCRKTKYHIAQISNSHKTLKYGYFSDEATIY